MIDKSFLLYKTQCKSLMKLSDLQRGKLIGQIISYVFDEEEPEAFEDLASEVLFDQIRDQIDRDQEKYLKKCEKNRKTAIAREEAKRQENTTVHEREQPCTNSTYTDTDTDTDKDTDNDTDTETEEDTEEKQPSSSEVKQFLSEYYPNIANKADRFYSHCQKNGWKTWKKRAKAWSDRERPEGNEDHGKPARFNGEESSLKLW